MCRVMTKIMMKILDMELSEEAMEELEVAEEAIFIVNQPLLPAQII